MNGDPGGGDARAVSSAVVRVLRTAAIALVPPLFGFAGEMWIFAALGSRWLLMVAAVVISAANGGMTTGLIATVVSAALTWWYLIPPVHTLAATNPEHYLVLALFLAIGFAISLLHERLRRTSASLADTVRQNKIFAALSENSLDFIGIADAHFKPVYVNPAGRRMVELPGDLEIERTNSADYYPPDQRAFARDLMAEVRARGKWAGETSLRNWRTGASIPVLETRFLIRDPATLTVIGIGTITRDISAQSARRDELEHANHQLAEMTREREEARVRAREAIDLAPDAYFLADLSARFTDINRAACRLLGVERDELIGKTIFDIIPPEDAPRLEEQRAKLLEPGTVLTNEWRLRRKDGSFVPVEVSANIIADGRWQAFVRDISERKRVEDERQVLVSLLDNSSDFIGIADPSGKPIYVNAAGRRLVGLAPDFPVGDTTIDQYYPAELRGFAKDVILKTMLAEGHWSGETSFRNFATNEAIPVSDTHFVIRDPADQRIIGLGTVTRDITEARKAADQRERALAQEQSANAKLRDSEERFRLTVDEAPIGMALVALDGRFVRVNHVLCEITGYGADELMRRTFQDITHPDDLATDVDLARRLAAGEIPRYQLEKRYVRKDQSTVDVMLSASVLRGPDGEARYYIAQVEDISARKRADAALRISEAKFSGIVSIAADGIITVDEKQRIMIFNEGAEGIFGYARSEVIGMPLERLIPKRFRQAHAGHFARFASGTVDARRMGERQDIFGLRKDGREFPAEGSISRVSAGGATLFSVVVRDVTYRKQVEEDLKRAVTAREEVLGIVAHDLRNPLGAILTATSLLERPTAGPERRDPTARDVIKRSAKRMNALIQDLLDVASIEAGQFKVDREQLSAAALVREAAELQRPLAVSSGLELGVDVAPDVGSISGDRHRLLQVFENLIGNAVKFTATGGRVTVSATVKGGELVFAVADTGAGIAAESLPHEFDRFWQAATRERRLGAGLGLPITRGIVEAHGGRIWVESTLGQGSTFFFTIPEGDRLRITPGASNLKSSKGDVAA
jgi:PAS domain S-box-containing protein